MPYQSHYDPHLLLQEHLFQVQTATDFLCACHSQMHPQTTHLMQAIVQCHDLGKGSPAFQQYINNPKTYQGEARAKAHTLLSTNLAILWAQQAQWDTLDILVLAQVVAGHHAGFRTLDDLEESLALDFEEPLEAQYQALDLTQLANITGLNLESIDNSQFKTAKRYLFKRQQVKKQLETLTLDQALGFRLWAQFCFSILLEADKALLALPDAKRYLQKNVWEIVPTQIDTYLSQKETKPIDAFRAKIQAQVMHQIPLNLKGAEKCFTLTLPTGAGKTLLATRWALTVRQQMASISKIPPKIIMVLPFLSIIEQTDDIYRQVFGVTAEEANTELLMASHSLSDSHYELEGKQVNDKEAEFFLNTWRSEVIITTFDQFLLALFSDRNRHLMRFHNLSDAVIILDEVQTLPPILWDIINQTLHTLTQEGQTQILMMSATQPLFLSPAQELAGKPEQVAEIFKQCQRYQIHLNYQNEQQIDDFIETLIPRVEKWLAEKKRIMITLNTRASAKQVWFALNEAFQTEQIVHLISADVTPRDRFKKIQAILDDMKQDRACLVVSTQTVEAGVDIDMDIVIRDFAPLDKIVQVAGRCNRNYSRGQYGGYVEVVYLLNSTGQKYAKKIYDSVLLDATYEILQSYDVIKEEDILPISTHYFQLLHNSMNTGDSLTKQFAYWEEMDDSVYALLRPNGEQINFIVLNDDEGEQLRSLLNKALKIQERWEKRRELRKLAGKLNERSVNVYQRSGFHPEDYAESVGYFWILKAKYYTEEVGLDLGLDKEDPAICLF